MQSPGPVRVSFSERCHCSPQPSWPQSTTSHRAMMSAPTHPRTQASPLLGLQGCLHPQWWVASGSAGSTHGQALTLILSRGQETVSLRPLYFSLHLSEILSPHNLGAWIWHQLNPSLKKIIQEETEAVQYHEQNFFLLTEQVTSARCSNGPVASREKMAEVASQELRSCSKP